MDHLQLFPDEHTLAYISELFHENRYEKNLSVLKDYSYLECLQPISSDLKS